MTSADLPDSWREWIAKAVAEAPPPPEAAIQLLRANNFPCTAGEAMKSESPAPEGKAITSTSDSSGQPAGSPATLAEWAAHYAQTGLEVFPVDPETKAPIGATEGANGETIWMATKGHTSATTDPQSSLHGGNCDPMP